MPGARCVQSSQPKFASLIGDQKRSTQLTTARIRSKMSDFDVDLHKKIQKSMQRDKQGRYDVSRRGKLATVLKDINDNVLLTEFIIVCLVNMDVNDIVDHFNGENPIIPQWKDGQKLKVAEAVKRSGLDGNKLIAAVRAVQTSNSKPEVLNVVAVCLLNVMEKGVSNLRTKVSIRETQLKGAKLKAEDRAAVIAAIANNPGLTINQKRAIKLAVSETKGKARTMVDLVDILNAIVLGSKPDTIQEALSFVDENADFESRKQDAIKAAEKSTLFSSDDAKNAVLKTIQSNKCVTPSNLVAILQAGLASKDATQIDISPTVISDASKVALISAFNRSPLVHSHPKTVEAAKHAVMKAETYAEQVVICQLFCKESSELDMRKGAKIAAVNGTKNLIAVTDIQRKKIVDGLKECTVVPGEYTHLFEQYIQYIKDQQQLVQMLCTAIVRAPLVLVEKLLKAWVPKEKDKIAVVSKKSKKKVLLDSVDENEKKAAIQAVKDCPTVSKSDINAATWALNESATQVHVMMILTAIVEGRSARNIKRALTENHLHPISDIPDSELKADIMNSVEQSKLAPGKKKAAIRAIQEAKRVSVIAAILAMAVANKSPPKILNATKLGDEFKVYFDVNKKEQDEKSKKMKAFEAKFGAILHSSILSYDQKFAAVTALSRPFTSPIKCELLLRILENQPAAEIGAAGDVRGIPRLLSLKEKTIFCQRIQATKMWHEDKTEICNEIKKAEEKKDAVFILEKALGKMESLSSDEMDALEVGATDCPHLDDEKRTYISGWLKRIDTRSRFFFLLLATLRWQVRPLHWVGVAYEEIFQSETLEPMSKASIDACHAAIKESKHSSKLKKAATDAIYRASTNGELCAILQAIIAEKSVSEIKACAKSDKKIEVKDLRSIFFDDDGGNENGDDEEKSKKRKKRKKKKESKAEKARDLHNAKMALEKNIKFDTSIISALRNALINVLHSHVSKNKELKVLARLVGILSQSSRYKDKGAKTEEASPQYIEMCHAVIEEYGDFDPAEQEKVMHEVADAKYVLAASLKLRDMVAKKSVTDGFVDDENFETFSFSPNKDIARPMDAEDKHLVVDHLERHPFASQAQKNAAKKVMLTMTNSRKQVLEVFKLLDNGGTPRQIAAISHRLQREKNDAMIQMDEENKVLAQKRAKRKEAEEKKRDRLVALSKRSSEMIEKLSGRFDLTDYQRTASIRMVRDTKTYTALATLLEGLLANLSGSQLRAIERSTHTKFNLERLETIVESSKLTNEAKAGAKRRLKEYGLNSDMERVAIIFEAMQTACAELDAEAELEAEKQADVMAAMKEKRVPEGAIAAADRSDIVSKIASGLIHHPQRRLVAIRSTTHIQTYYNLTGVLFNVVMMSSDSAIEKAAAGKKLVVDIPKATATKLAHELSTSSMLATFHGHQANDCLKGVTASSTYKGVCDVLLETIVAYGKVLDTHAPSPPTKQKLNRGGGAKYRRFTEKVLKSNGNEEDEDLNNLKKRPPSKLVPMQRRRLLVGLENYKYLPKGSKYSLHHLLEEKVQLVVEANTVIAAVMLAAENAMSQKKRKAQIIAEEKARKKSEKAVAKQKIEEERARRKEEARKAAKEAKEAKQKARIEKKEAIRRKRQMEAEKRRYKVTFDEGPMGMGIDPPHNAPVGSVVTVVVEDSQAGKSGKIRVGDSVISINGVDITHLDHEETVEELKQATRPMEIIFELAPYHHHDVSAEEDLRNIFTQIENENSVAKVDKKKFHAAFHKAGIELEEEDINTVLNHLKEDIEEEELEYEEFLHYCFNMTKHAEELEDMHKESDTESEVDTEDELEEKQVQKIKAIWKRIDKKGVGSVSRDEIQQGFAEMGMKMTEEQLAEMMSHIDDDNSGSVNFDEFLAFSMASIMKKKHDNDSDSEKEETEDLLDFDIEGDPGVKALKRLATLEGFGIKNPTDFPSLQDKTDLKRAVNAAPVDPSIYLPRVDAVKSAQDILNVYEALLYFEDQAYTNRLESLKSYTLAPEDTKEIVPTDRRGTTLTYEFISDEEGDEAEEVDEHYGRRKKVHKKKLPHNLMIKNKKKDENRRARLPRAQFTINV